MKTWQVAWSLGKWEHCHINEIRTVIYGFNGSTNRRQINTISYQLPGSPILWPEVLSTDDVGVYGGIYTVECKSRSIFPTCHIRHLKLITKICYLGPGYCMDIEWGNRDPFRFQRIYSLDSYCNVTYTFILIRKITAVRKY